MPPHSSAFFHQVGEPNRPPELAGLGLPSRVNFVVGDVHLSVPYSLY